MVFKAERDMPGVFCKKFIACQWLWSNCRNIRKSFYRRKYNPGRVLPQKCVFGGVGRETNESLCSPSKKTVETLVQIVLQRIRSVTTIISDERKSYASLSQYSYTHLTLNHSRGFINRSKCAYIQKIESWWGKAKQRNKLQSGTQGSMLNTYFSAFFQTKQHQDEDCLMSL